MSGNQYLLMKALRNEINRWLALNPMQKPIIETSFVKNEPFIWEKSFYLYYKWANVYSLRSC
ncbi:hypothetical protein BKI52_10385 [marine bacterium AO1-C]|nr:hypothetical protein BKI52_10385 [marine bacterium AO1-C]